ncbi:hypothetical protein OKJ48_10430 [Streptomyces kunmingensis]|uniref:Stress-response A/B barrel domain-containing protein n=1 Tax=Streptomyces kunmingensis TaxID=68225 RepID=A0ABU6C7I3_9ACTN|nr:hypothetical protein [Streptomyces kunmingensis]MEB3960654.1 hypothetical protein [Streptomyces kunmingensis]
MIKHTMMVSFTDTLPAAEVDQYLADIERVMRESGVVQSFEARPHLPVPGEEAVPALIATVIVQFSVADMETLAKAFAVPGLHEIIGHWQARHPYKVAYANHEAFA